MSDKSKRTETVRYVHQFTMAERAELAQSVSDLLAEVVEIEDEKASVMADFTSRLKSKKAEMRATNRKMRDGFEERTAECGVTRDFDRMKVFYHNLMTGELVKERDMEGPDMQLDLDEGDE